jgi:hypothetical protein
MPMIGLVQSGSKLLFRVFRVTLATNCYATLSGKGRKQKIVLYRVVGSHE